MQISNLIWVPYDKNITPFYLTLQKNLPDQMSSKLEKIMHREFFDCVKRILTTIMPQNIANVKNTTQMVKLSPKSLAVVIVLLIYHDSEHDCCIKNSCLQ